MAHSAMNRLRHLYVEELKDLYSAESQLVKALPKMAKASTSEALRAGFEGHLEQTKEHIACLLYTSSWGQFMAMLFCQVGRAHSLREICGGLACCEGQLKHCLLYTSRCV